MKYTLYLSHFFVPPTLAKLSWILAICVVPQALMVPIHRSTLFTWFLTRSCLAFIDPHNFCGSLHPGSLSHRLNFFRCSSSQNCSFLGSWLLLFDTIQWLGVWLTHSYIRPIPSGCTGPVQVRSSQAVIWTHQIPVEISLGLDRTKPGLVDSLLTSFPSWGSGANNHKLVLRLQPRLKLRALAQAVALALAQTLVRSGVLGFLRQCRPVLLVKLNL